MSKCEKIDCSLVLSVDTEQFIHLLVDETQYNLCGNLKCTGDGKRVGEDGAIVPECMAIGTRPIFVGIAPECAGVDGDDRSLSN